MALRMTAPVNAGETTLQKENAYLQARPLMLDKQRRTRVDEEGNALLVDGEPVTETYWCQTAELRWFTDNPANGGTQLRTHLDQVRFEVDLAAIGGDPIAALYASLKADVRFADAVDA